MSTTVLLRRLHLACAFVLLGFVGMYVLTGYVLTHGSWFGEGSEQVVRRSESPPAEALANPDSPAFATDLKRRLGLQGKPSTVERRGDGTWRVTYSHPGHVSEVTVASDRTRVSVVEKRFGWQRTLRGLHRFHGYGAGGVYTLWAVMVDLNAVAMIVFAITGFLLWHRRTRDRRVGWAMLSLGFALTASTIAFLLVRR